MATIQFYGNGKADEIEVLKGQVAELQAALKKLCWLLEHTGSGQGLTILNPMTFDAPLAPFRDEPDYVKQLRAHGMAPGQRKESA